MFAHTGQHPAARKTKSNILLLIGQAWVSMPKLFSYTGGGRLISTKINECGLPLSALQRPPYHLLQLFLTATTPVVSQASPLANTPSHTHAAWGCQTIAISWPANCCLKEHRQSSLVLSRLWTPLALFPFTHIHASHSSIHQSCTFEWISPNCLTEKNIHKIHSFPRSWNIKIQNMQGNGILYHLTSFHNQSITANTS